MGQELDVLTWHSGDTQDIIIEILQSMLWLNNTCSLELVTEFHVCTYPNPVENQYAYASITQHAQNYQQQRQQVTQGCSQALLQFLPHQ